MSLREGCALASVASAQRGGRDDRQTGSSQWQCCNYPTVRCRTHSASLTLRSTGLSEDHPSGGSQDATFTGLRGTSHFYTLIPDPRTPLSARYTYSLHPSSPGGVAIPLPFCFCNVFNTDCRSNSVFLPVA